MRHKAARGKGKSTNTLSTLSHLPASPGRRSLPSVSIIGAGRLGTALAIALGSRGYTIEAVVARRLTHARRAARLINSSLLNSSPRSLSSAQLELLPQSDLFIITTPDDAISETAAQLAAAMPGRGQTALHASGALSSVVLQSLRDAGFHTGSMHPLVSVSDAGAGAESLREAFYCIEGDAKAVRLARRLVRDLGGQSFSISANDKALYHAAAVMASGHTTALFDLAAGMLQRCGLAKRRARAVLMPLMRSTIDNLSLHEPARALTGTFARADMATVKRHLAALRPRDLRDALAAYVLLGQHSLKLAQRNGANTDAVRKIAAALAEVETTKAGK